MYAYLFLESIKVPDNFLAKSRLTFANRTELRWDFFKADMSQTRNSQKGQGQAKSAGGVLFENFWFGSCPL